jgi:5-methylcytosine-specific restriction endonuclease McrA
LTIELVPSTCWCSNVRDLVSRKEWDRIRRQVYAAADNRCEVCGGRGRTRAVDCHEVWEYDEATGTQRLVRMIALCPACHGVKHIGLTGNRGYGEEASAHLAEVNGWSPEQARQHIAKALVIFEERSTRPWSLDVSALAPYGVYPSIIAEAQRASPEERAKSAGERLAKRLSEGRRSE